MALTTGTRIGCYEITSPLGEGGMGVVYRAHDTKLGRDVAIKVLPDAFANDTDRLHRFRREAQVLASLNHPNIGQIYGFEESDTTHCLVLELVEGDTLQERLKRGPIPLDDALQIAKQVAEALDAAHEKGIIHRDLKPANIKLSHAGKVKVLDFGLAKAFQDEQPATLSNSPTLMSASVPGVIMGTAAYMSPEQAKGKQTDRTSDVWAFGCVFYEMLTGSAVFEGETIGEILAEIFKGDPDWSRLPSATPEAIRRLLRRCLQKDPTLRLRDIGDARIEILEVQSGKPIDAQMGPPSLPRKERLAWISALALVILLAAGGITWVRRSPSSSATASEIRLDIAAPPAFDPASLAISPDGRRIVFEATSEGMRQLWLRSLDSASARPLERTEGAAWPFWSPDSQSVGFFADNKLKRVDIDGGFVQTLADAPRSRGGTWSSDGTILFAGLPPIGILRIPATGGEAVAVLKLEAGNAAMFPQFLPDGRHFLYYSQSEPRGIYISQLDGSGRRRLFDADSSAVYASSGQLLFVRQGTLFGQNFDSVQLTPSGNPFPIAEQLSVLPTSPKAPVSASAQGSIVYRAGYGKTQRQLVWVDRSGKEIEKVGASDKQNPMEPSLSPDGSRLALRREVNGNSPDIWLLEVKRGVLSRFTSTEAPESNPVWSPDGGRIVFGSPRKNQTDLFLKPTSGAGNDELLLTTAQNKSATDWSPDGRFVLFRSSDPKLAYDLWAVLVDGDRKPFPVVQTNADEPDGEFSPDGKWIAYQSNESGRYEIYVQAFPGPGSKSLVSTNGGAQVRWRPDGKEIFYVALDGRLMAVPIRLAANGQAIEPGTPVPLFDTRLGGAIQTTNRPQYVVSGDGQRFLMNSVIEEAGTSPITVILNWKPKN